MFMFSKNVCEFKTFFQFKNSLKIWKFHKLIIYSWFQKMNSIFLHDFEKCSLSKKIFTNLENVHNLKNVGELKNVLGFESCSHISNIIRNFHKKVLIFQKMFVNPKIFSDFKRYSWIWKLLSYFKKCSWIWKLFFWISKIVQHF